MAWQGTLEQSFGMHVLQDPSLVQPKLGSKLTAREPKQEDPLCSSFVSCALAGGCQARDFRPRHRTPGRLSPCIHEDTKLLYKQHKVNPHRWKMKDIPHRANMRQSCLAHDWTQDKDNYYCRLHQCKRNPLGRLFTSRRLPKCATTCKTKRQRAFLSQSLTFTSSKFIKS